MKADIIDIFDSSVAAESVEVSDFIFGAEMRADIIKRVVDWQLAKRRGGNRKTKTIGEVSGTTAKPHSQKGTGRARQGSKRSPQFRGGAIIFGPVVRDHSYSLQKKVRKLGVRVALSEKLRQGNLLFVQEPKVAVTKTSEVVKKLKDSGIGGKEKVLFIVNDEVSDHFKKSISNIVGVNILHQRGINVYDIMKNNKVVVIKPSITYIEENLA